MDAVAVALMGFGAYLMYEAYKNPNPTPITKATTTLSSNKAVA
jgi:hypothetical protein